MFRPDKVVSALVVDDFHLFGVPLELNQAGSPRDGAELDSFSETTGV